VRVSLAQKYFGKPKNFNMFQVLPIALVPLLGKLTPLIMILGSMLACGDSDFITYFNFTKVDLPFLILILKWGFP
jgi:hypothetical protein